MKLGVAAPERLVDVTRVLDAGVRDADGGGLRIGAGARNADLAAEPAVRERYPALSQALLAGASGQLRNMATVGGNLLQRTRCTYFQDVTKPCNKREPGSGCPAIDGRPPQPRDPRALAVVRGDEPVGHGRRAGRASTPSCTSAAPAASGRSRCPACTACPATSPQRDTVLEPGELITAVELPALALAANSRYRKVRDRASYAFAVASVAVALDVADGAVADCRIAFGGLAPVPWRALRAEDAPARRARHRGELRRRRRRRAGRRPAAARQRLQGDARAQPAHRHPLGARLMATTLSALGRRPRRARRRPREGHRRRALRLRAADRERRLRLARAVRRSPAARVTAVDAVGRAGAARRARRARPRERAAHRRRCRTASSRCCRRPTSTTAARSSPSCSPTASRPPARAPPR